MKSGSEWTTLKTFLSKLAFSVRERLMYRVLFLGGLPRISVIQLNRFSASFKFTLTRFDYINFHIVLLLLILPDLDQVQEIVRRQKVYNLDRIEHQTSLIKPHTSIRRWLGEAGAKLLCVHNEKVLQPWSKERDLMCPLINVVRVVCISLSQSP